MTRYRLLPWLAGLNLLALTACASPAGAIVPPRPDATTAPLGLDLGASSRAPSRHIEDAAEAASRPGPARPSVRLVAEAQADVPATGVVNSVDASAKRINLTHQPIPAIGWPAMTMDFPVTPSVELGGIKPGNRVNVMLRKGKDGMYEIRSVQRAAASP